jgi:hypothetical protein
VWVQRLGLTARCVFAVVVGLAMVGDTTVRASILAMACCAKTHGDCAGVRSPDDCCRGMGHVSAGPVSTTAPSGPTFDPPFTAAVLAPAATANFEIGSFPVFLSIAFKRPHDPPHLHAFTLLI